MRERTKYCFTYCGDDLCDCGLADDIRLPIIIKRVAPAGDMIDENTSVPPSQGLEQDVAPAKGRP